MSRSTNISTVVVCALALNLRPAVTSLGAALADVSVARNLTAAVLVALPLWAIGIGGWLTPNCRTRRPDPRLFPLFTSMPLARWRADRVP